MQKTKSNSDFFLVKQEVSLKQLFEAKKYLEVINKVEKMKVTIDNEVLDYFFFNNKISCLIYQGLSFIEIGLYKRALELFDCIDEKYETIKASKTYWKMLSKNPENKQEFEISKDALSLLNEQILIFGTTNQIRFLSNKAYVYYRLEDYKNSIIYYKKALVRDNKNIQLNLGIAQAQYYEYRKKFKSKILNNIYLFFNSKMPVKIILNFKKTISMLEARETSFDNLLALGKMYYFMGRYEESLLYVQKSLTLSENKPEKNIYAYDWLSRIAFKTKHHSVAVGYYKEIIKSLIENPDSKQEVIHPKPDLYKMLDFLTQNEEKVTKNEVHYINKSIWGGIIAALILESAEIYSNTNSFHIPLIMIVLTLIVSTIYINVYK